MLKYYIYISETNESLTHNEIEHEEAEPDEGKGLGDCRGRVGTFWLCPSILLEAT